MTEENIDSHAVKGGVYRTLLNLIAEQDFGRLCTMVFSSEMKRKGLQ